MIEFAPLLPVSLIAAACAIALVCAARSIITTPHHRAARALLPLRLLAIAIVALSLAQPGERRAPTDHQAQPITLLVDDSASMSLATESTASNLAPNASAAPLSRFDELRRTWLAPESLAALQAHAPLTILTTSGDSVPVDRVAALAPGAPTTPLWDALRRLAASHFSTTTTSAPRDVIVLSDGRDSSGPLPADLAPSLTNQNLRVFVVPVGSSDPSRDAHVDVLAPPGVVRLGDAAPLRVRVVAPAHTNAPLTIHVREPDHSDEPLASRTITPGEPREFDIALPITAPPRNAPAHGTRLYQVSLEPPAGDTNQANNAAWAAVQVVESSPRVLVIDGSPTWDTRLFVRALDADPAAHFTTITAVAAESSDQPAPALRMTHREPTPTGARTTFGSAPSSLDDLLISADVIVLGSHLERVLGPQHGTILRDLAARGTPLLFLSAQPFDDGELADLSPTTPAPAELNWDDAQWRTPPLTTPRASAGGAELGAPKPHTRVWAWNVDADSGVSQPTIVAARTSRAIVARSAPGIWRLSSPDASGERTSPAGLARQLIWLLTTGDEAPPTPPLVLSAEPARARVGETVRLVLRARDAAASLTDWKLVSEPGGTPLPLTQDHTSADSTACWNAAFTPTQGGVARFTLHSAQGGVSAQTSVIVANTDPERDEPSTDLASLRQLALSTGGVPLGVAEQARYLDLARRTVVALHAPATFEPLAITPWLPLLACIPLLLEWTLRRRSGLR